jgi:hypothetical protein
MAAGEESMSSIDVIDVLRAKAEPGRYPVNLRITVPFLPKPFFITLIIGPERRGRERRRLERSRYPLNTWGNLAVAVGAWTTFVVATFFVTLIATQ